MKVLYAGLLLWFLACPGLVQATSCMPPSDNYILLCQQDGCFDGYRFHEVSTGSECERRPVVDDVIDKDITAMASQVYQSSHFAGQPGIYQFSLHQRAFWLSLKFPKYHDLMKDYPKKI
ncbi:MAG: hypothetical protein HRT35_17895 [Algicola sp.]|nr:hypothetical protein [Algicola sp.]